MGFLTNADDARVNIETPYYGNTMPALYAQPPAPSQAPVEVEFDLPALEEYGRLLFTPFRQTLIKMTCNPISMDKVLQSYQSQRVSITYTELIFRSNAEVYPETRVRLQDIVNINVTQDSEGKRCNVFLMDIQLPIVVGQVCLFRLVGPKYANELRNFIYAKRDQLRNPAPVVMQVPMPMAPPATGSNLDELNERIRQLEAQVAKQKEAET